MKPTEPVAIGRTEICVTRLGFGAGVLGGLFEEVPEDVAVATVRKALRLGLNYIDTAPLYGHGKSEMRLGLALEGVERQSFVISTKVGRLLVPAAEEVESIWFKNLPALEPVFDFSYDGVHRSLEESIERLRLDRIDLLHVHDPDGAFEEVMRGAYVALEDLRAQSVVRAISVGCWDPRLLVRFARSGDFDAFLVPGCYTLLDQSALDELLPLCIDRKISIVVGAPYGSGILASGSQPGAKYKYADVDRDTIERVRRIEAVCARHGVPLQAAALQFPFGHPSVSTIVPGARSPHEVELAFQMFQCPIPNKFWDELKTEGLIRADAPTPTLFEETS